MAKINTYQRRQLASSVTGVPAADASGQVIGKSMQNLGVALIKRQDALDTAKLSTAYYEYAAANNIASMTLRKKYQADTTLDPTTFDTEFKRGSAELALTFKENMSNRLHNRFDVLVSKADASQSVANNKWAFDQQNRNALTDFQNLNETSAVLAGDAMNPEDYLLGRAHYLDSAGAHQAIMTPVSYDRTIKSSLKQQAAM
ncbi:MAG: hypothetical protein KAU50_04380, partial [Candidatus Marinimicrobia bacterium]|nr:hypothetical protein [Candidatus Neomarinimicrobiota bacterium]